MSHVMAYVLTALVAYLMGSIPFGLIISLYRGIDIRKAGSGNIGATNVFRSVGKRWGVLTFILDAMKGFVPTYILPCIVNDLCPAMTHSHCGALALTCACAAVAGHNWPVFLRFKGGKGVATTAGALLAVAWPSLLIGLATWLIVLLATRYVSVASIVAALVVAIAGWMLPSAKSGGLALQLVLTLVAGVLIFRHRANIQRLLKGNENRFQFKRARGTDSNSGNGQAG